MLSAQDQLLEKHIRDKEAFVYDTIQNRYRTRFFVWTRNKLTKIFLSHAARILDAGCGTGSLLSHFRGDEWKKVIGVDFSFKSLLVAKDRHQSKLLLSCSNLQSLPFPDRCFDGVSCLGVLQHIPGDLRLSVLLELARVSRSGAVLVLQVYNAETAPRFGFKQGDGRFETGMYYHTFSYDELSDVLEQSGWRIVKVSGYGALRYFLSSIRGGMRFYKYFAFLTFPIEYGITLWGGKGISKYSEYFYVSCMKNDQCL